jgi:hypothetical protein
MSMLTQRARISLSRLNLVNGDVGESGTLLGVLDAVARVALGTGPQHAYVVTCYFDLPAIAAFGRTARKHVERAGGRLQGLVVAVEAGEWIRCRRSVAEVKDEVATLSKVRNVTVVPVKVEGRLLHAKAYAVISDAKEHKGFLAVTSGNATGRGLGLAKNANIELATVTTDSAELHAFKDIVEALLEHEVTEEDALRQDMFLRALFSAGSFYHRWQGSLSSEVRFKMTLIAKGKRVRKENVAAFRDYEPDSDTMSRDPLEIERVFERIPKPFPASLWRTYAVDTLLGYWTPAPIAAVVDRKLKADVEPYLNAIRNRTAPARVDKIADRLTVDLREFARKGWVTESPDVVDTWRERVDRFRGNEDILRLRIHPYSRVPDLLEGASRDAILKMQETLSVQLNSKKKLGGTKSVIAGFSAGDLSRSDLDEEFRGLAEEATASSTSTIPRNLVSRQP